MPPALHHPDLAAPPMGWSYAKVGSQIWLSPPGNVDGAEGAAIIVSPLLARHKGLPSLERVITAAIETEARGRLHVLERSGPTAMKTTTGLVGCCFEVHAEVRGRGTERRIYVMYGDALCYYGIHYVAGEAAYEKYLKPFLDAARSVKPFQGRALASGTGGAEERALHGSYQD